MTNRDEQLKELAAKLNLLMKQQENFSQEIHRLRFTLNELQQQNKRETRLVNPTLKPPAPETPLVEHTPPTTPASPPTAPTQPALNTYNNRIKQQQLKQHPQPSSSIKSDWERFIGENLINKIGIAITVIGVGLGAKYSIENNLISPLTRLILGYLFAAGLLGVGIKLKRQYENYSAVLVSGAIAIMYFLTFAAYNIYHFIPQTVAFLMMVIFTLFTVLAALNYNLQVIAHIGLVGAYAVPFLLSEGSGQVNILFSYMAIINTGILVLAFKKYWKPLYYTSMSLTWLIFLTWGVTSYNGGTQQTTGLVFLTLFFVLFYVTIVAYKLLHREKFGPADIIQLLSNAFIFYGIGYALIHNQESTKHLTGLFTLSNALAHVVASMVIMAQKDYDKQLRMLVSGLAVVFITLSVPVQLDGSWVTLLWTGEAVLLFWIGRTKQVSFYEYLSYPLMALATLSLLITWQHGYQHYASIHKPALTPVFNIHFLTSLLFVAAFVVINHLHRLHQPSNPVTPPIKYQINILLPAILILVAYMACYLEIHHYCKQLYLNSSVKDPHADKEFSVFIYNTNLEWFRQVWLINYTLVFTIALAFINRKKYKSEVLSHTSMALLCLSLILFLTIGLFALSELRDAYLTQQYSMYYHIGVTQVWVRYLSFPLVALILLLLRWHTHQPFAHPSLQPAFDMVLHICVLWISSSELINWMTLGGSGHAYKIGLSILWGSYSLLLIALGIWKKKKNLRIGAMALFALTLIKLFFYDISHLNTIAKTIVFVALGVLLLISSFLYNKYKHLIAGNDNNN